MKILGLLGGDMYGFENLFTDELVEHYYLINSGIVKVSSDEMKELEIELMKRGLLESQES